MTRTQLSRIAALEAAHGAHGMDITAVFNAIHRLNELRHTFPTLDAWLAYKKEQQSTWTLAAPLSAELARLRAARPEEDARSRLTEEREWNAWRRERGAYLNAHPDEVRCDQDRELLADRKAAGMLYIRLDTAR